MKNLTPQQPGLEVATAPKLPVGRPDETAVPSVASMLQAVIQGGVSNENVAALEKLVGLYERMQDRDAEKAFAAAFMALQAEIPRVKATKVIPDRNNNMRSSFAPFEEIDTQLRPIAEKHGFTYSFKEGPFDQGRICKICVVTHAGGHTRENPFSVRIGSGPPGCTESQADGAAHSYAKRGALCDAFNIVVVGIDKDGDARMEGDKVTTITKAQAEELEHRVKMTNSNVASFLQLGGLSDADVKTGAFSKILASRYDSLDALLRRKEKDGK
jgi:hypothetical protein